MNKSLSIGIIFLILKEIFSFNFLIASIPINLFHVDQLSLVQHKVSVRQ